jgi:hypothetical protein
MRRSLNLITVKRMDEFDASHLCTIVHTAGCCNDQKSTNHFRMPIARGWHGLYGLDSDGPRPPIWSGRSRIRKVRGRICGLYGLDSDTCVRSNGLIRLGSDASVRLNVLIRLGSSARVRLYVLIRLGSNARVRLHGLIRFGFGWSAPGCIAQLRSYRVVRVRTCLGSDAYAMCVICEI